MNTAAKKRAARRRDARRGDTLPLLPLLIGGIVLAGVAAVVLVATSGDDEGAADLGPQTRPVEVDGTALGPLPEPPAVDDQVGAVAPNLTGEDFDGNPVEIRATGRPQVIAFLAHWCPHCNNEGPRLARYLEEEGLPEGIDLYLVSTNADSASPHYPPETWLDEMGLTQLDLPTLVDSDGVDAYRAYGQPGFPYFALLDADHRVVLRLAGELPEGAFGPLFEALAKGETPVDPRLAG